VARSIQTSGAPRDRNTAANPCQYHCVGVAYKPRCNLVGRNPKIFCPAYRTIKDQQTGDLSAVRSVGTPIRLFLGPPHPSTLKPTDASCILAFRHQSSNIRRSPGVAASNHHTPFPGNAQLSVVSGEIAQPLLGLNISILLFRQSGTLLEQERLLVSSDPPAQPTQRHGRGPATRRFRLHSRTTQASVVRFR
jgi:hypothetical protein